MSRQLTWGGVFLRFLFALLIVFLSYNPEGYSYYHWGVENFFPFTPLKLIAGILLVIGWVIFVRATLRSLGTVGLVLVTGLCGAILWLMIDSGWTSEDSLRFYTYAGLIIITVLLTVGMSWSHIRRNLSGQYDMDDVDNDD
ncbi:DUF6524 family protein [Sulfuriflexus sp.]|uniref:DUF6524 family protein n=1 Tax=Sulfuriflexus sp. TaxID=2015443 RepID=UPI0028CC95BE|nr:DUF6524 family protein [Sulfuriflexus sp.]MDT8405469.1 DUF6524 family protein [Sulfuriflexus sp.]